jgi:hypothetical protein
MKLFLFILISMITTNSFANEIDYKQFYQQTPKLIDCQMIEIEAITNDRCFILKDIVCQYSIMLDNKKCTAYIDMTAKKIINIDCGVYK